MNVTDIDVAVPGWSSRPTSRAGEFHRPIRERRAQPMTSEQPVHAPAPSGLFRDVMAMFGSVSVPMEIRPAVDDDLPLEGNGP